ncbi:uncharacterized protein LOC131697790 [Acipenser ruthenus]|uniref:uncharacterized protein LOC131697790 n=1 Tax=Acipenser ruthenus TaxID=7906 RepID=UPI00274222DA|nr:uncharacterized protein LOC131697790 [Acipenser ruthenus]
MILNDMSQELNVALKFKIDENSYIIFATTDVMRCFGCGKEGHVVKNCPENEASTAEQDKGKKSEHKETERREEGKEIGNDSNNSADAGNESSRQTETQGDERLEQEASTEVNIGELAVTGKQSRETATTSAEKQSALDVDSAVEAGCSKKMQYTSESVELKQTESNVKSVEVKQTESVVEAVELNPTAGEESKINSVLEKMDVETVEEKFKFKTPKKKRQRKREDDETAKKRANVIEESEAAPGKSKTTVPWSVRVASKTPEESSEIDSEEEAVLTDCSQTSDSALSGTGYSVSNIKDFLEITKGRRGINIEDHFPNISLFLLAARFTSQKASGSDLTEQERWRLKNLIARVSKQLKKKT